MQRNTRSDVVAQALVVLDQHGLGDLTMRRLGAELGVRPSALYHHVASKQELLAAAADELLRRGPHRPRPTAWTEAVGVVCTDLREAVLAYRDGAEVVAAARAFGLGAHAPYDDLVAVLGTCGFEAPTVEVGARTLLHFVLGHCVDEQTHLQASAAGAIEDAPRERSDFALGLDLVVGGLQARLAQEQAGRVDRRVGRGVTVRRPRP